jgi:hypothetical protein
MTGLAVSVLVFSMAFGAREVAVARAAPPAEAEPSEVRTEPAEATANGFRLKGRLNPENSPTTYFFIYSRHRGPCELEPFGCGLTTAIGGPLTGDTQQEVSPIEATGLIPGETYSYWLLARNANGAPYGQEQTFTTPAEPEAAPSEVRTEPAEATANGFKLRGRLNPEGLPTTYYFIYKDRGAECEDEYGCGPETAVSGPLVGDTQQEVSPIEVTGLDPGRTYIYWLLARNAKGIRVGEQLTFVAGPPATENSSAPTSTQTDATLQAPVSAVSLPGVAAASATNSQMGASAPPGVSPKRTVLNRKLSKALRVCRKKPRSRRAACATQARKKYR